MKEICPTMVPFSTPCICLFRSIFILSYPCNVFHAVLKEKKPMPGLTSRLTNRWSCSIRVLRYLLCRSSHEAARSPAAFNSLKALGEAAFLSTVITRGATVWEAPSAFAKKRFAAWVSRVALHRNSKVFPRKSTARERSIHTPLIFAEVSSTRHESVVSLRCARQRFSS